MQRQHSSQATSMLGNTPNLTIGSYNGKHCIGSQTKETLYWFPDRELGLGLLSFYQA